MPFNWTAGGAPNYVGENIAYSCRFNDGDSPRTSRTPGAAGTEETWTFSAWVKLCKVAAANATIFSAFSDVNNHFKITFRSTGDLSYGNVTGGVWDFYRSLDRIFRDPTGWTHVCIAMDTTQSTAADRTTCWINGVEMTAYDDGGTGGGTDPDLNFVTDVNTTIAHNIGCLTGGNEQFDGYLAEVHFTDGTAYTASDFGQTNGLTGEWVPKGVAVTYGTNGFYLDFSNSSNFGEDQSGNNNDFTDSGLATNDQLTDTPTNNHCVCSEIHQGAGTSTVTSNGGLDWSISSSAGNAQQAQMGVTMAVSSGKWYWEFSPSNLASVVLLGGIHQEPHNMNIGQLTSPNEIYTYRSDGNKHSRTGGSVAYGDAYLATEVVGVALDLDNGAIWFSNEGVWQASATAGEIAAGTTTNAAFTGLSGTYAPHWGCASSNATQTGTVNFGQQAFTHTAPTGFKALCTANLTAPAIVDPRLQFNTVLYTGNGTAVGSGGNAVTGFGFGPDLLWIKNRDQLDDHMMGNLVSGTGVYLEPNTTDAQAADTESFGTFGTDGFTVGSNVAVNTNTENYAAWGWNGNGSSGASNSDGSITSTINVNTAAGISMGTYTGTGSNATVGHGLGAAPEVVIVKRTDTGGSGWNMYHSGLTSATYAIFLDDTAAEASDATKWNSTAPTTSVFSLGTSTAVNGSTFTYFFIAFKNIEGFLKSGKYVGNGSTDGPFVYLGFRPAWLICKKIASATDGWPILDSARDTYNPCSAGLYSDATSVEFVANNVDFVATGFKIRGTGAPVNTSGSTYVYIAMAEAPMNYARAR